MARRRRTTAAQKAASRRNLIKARAVLARRRRHRTAAGPQVRLYHRTSTANAKRLSSGGKWKHSPVYLTTRKNLSWVRAVGIGPATVSVKLPRNKLRKDPTGPPHGRNVFGAAEQWFVVSAKTLQGRRVTREHRARRRR